ncbi:hypothetical protein [Bacteroides sp. An269]|nr:hypothetical protein [Bacteroides sp. An269]OUO71174.1 hypothetical protein B5F71_15680 [Bacteroides sp. An269]
MNEKGHYDVNAYAEAHFEALAKEELLMRISTDTYLLTIEDFCEKNQLEITEKDEVYQVLLYACALLMRNKLETTESTLEDMNYEYQEYIHAIRPDMLKLYIGLHHNDSLNDKVKKYHKQCRISFGDLSPIKIDEQTPWFQEALDRYLEKYLGVKSVKEAEQELYAIYGKTVGAKMNVNAIRFMWGTYHLLQDIPNCKSKTEKSVTKKQGRIIADLLNRLNLIEYKEKESFLDYMDGERIRVSLKNYLMQYDSIDDIIKAKQYKTSPNNTDSSRYY